MFDLRAEILRVPHPLRSKGWESTFLSRSKLRTERGAKRLQVEAGDFSPRNKTVAKGDHLTAWAIRGPRRTILCVEVRERRQSRAMLEILSSPSGERNLLTHTFQGPKTSPKLAYYFHLNC